MSQVVTFTMFSLLSCNIATVLLETNMNSACATFVSMHSGERPQIFRIPIDRSQAQHLPERVIATTTTSEIAIWQTVSRPGVKRLTLTLDIRHSNWIQPICQSVHARIQPAKQTRDGILCSCSWDCHFPIAMLNAVPLRKESMCLAWNEAAAPEERPSGTGNAPCKRPFDVGAEVSRSSNNGLRAKGSIISGEDNILYHLRETHWDWNI